MSKVQIEAEDWRFANDPGFMRKIKVKFPDMYAEMIRQVRGDRPPEACCCCFFYYHLKNKDGTIYAGGCSIDDEIMIMDMLKREEDCPL